MPFGLHDAPLAFQCEMNAFFGHVPYVLVYLDDTLVFSISDGDHY